MEGVHITEEEFGWAWGKSKVRRAKGLDGIENEALVYGGDAVKKCVYGIMGEVGRGAGMMESWENPSWYRCGMGKVRGIM